MILIRDQLGELVCYIDNFNSVYISTSYTKYKKMILPLRQSIKNKTLQHIDNQPCPCIQINHNELVK